MDDSTDREHNLELATAGYFMLELHAFSNFQQKNKNVCVHHEMLYCMSHHDRHNLCVCLSKQTMI